MARKKRTYNGVTITVNSRKSVAETILVGKLSAKTEELTGAKVAEVLNELTFDEIDGDKALVIVGERKWIPIKVDKKNGLRVTKNKETGEYRILCSLTKEKLQSMTLRNVGELEAEFGLMIEKIRL